MVQLAQLAVELDRRLGRRDAVAVAPVRERAVRHGEIRVEARLEGRVPDPLGQLETPTARLDERTVKASGARSARVHPGPTPWRVRKRRHPPACRGPLVAKVGGGASRDAARR